MQRSIPLDLPCMTGDSYIVEYHRMMMMVYPKSSDPHSTIHADLSPCSPAGDASRQAMVYTLYKLRSTSSQAMSEDYA